MIAAVFLVPSSASAVVPASETMNICRQAATAAADRHDIPREVMQAITLVETRTRRDGQSGPWPWTVNVAGKGGWFESRAAALLHAQRALAGGETSFDVGCFQLNFRWHGKHFASIDHMFEPEPSGDYAARFLKDLHAETGDWLRAAGLYHSRTPKHSNRYRALVADAVAGMDGQSFEVAAKPIEQVPQTRHVTRVARANTEWPLRSMGAVRIPTQPGATAGALGMGALRRATGGLIVRAAKQAGG